MDSCNTPSTDGLLALLPIASAWYTVATYYYMTETPSIVNMTIKNAKSNGGVGTTAPTNLNFPAYKSFGLKSKNISRSPAVQDGGSAPFSQGAIKKCWPENKHLRE